MNTARYISKLLVVLLVAAVIEGCGDDTMESKREAAQGVTPAPVQMAPVPAAPRAQMSEADDASAAAVPAQPADAMTMSPTESSPTGSGEAADEPGSNAIAPAPDASAVEQREEAEERVVPPAAREDAMKMTPTVEQVRRIQQHLRDLGFEPGAVDGMPGPRTMAALKQFQQQNGLAVGAITGETLAALQRSAESGSAATR